MDRFLGTIALRKNQFQLLGAAAIFLASKMEEPTPVSATTLVKWTAATYDREELLVSVTNFFLSLKTWKIWRDFWYYIYWKISAHTGSI